MMPFRHIRSKYDKDPCANTFIRCKVCGAWSDASYGNSCCPYCYSDFDGSEDTKRGIYPPGWGMDDES